MTFNYSNFCHHCKLGEIANHARVCHLSLDVLESLPQPLDRSLVVSSQCLESCLCLWLPLGYDLGKSEYPQVWCSQQEEGQVPTQ